MDRRAADGRTHGTLKELLRVLMIFSFTALGVFLAKAVLGLASITSVAIMIERAIRLSAVSSQETADYEGMKKALALRDAAAARRYLSESAAPCLQALGDGLMLRDAGEDRVREAIQQGVVVHSVRLQGRLPLLATIASTAPYVGLFGTVVGILAAFHEIAVTGRTGASVVSGGISEALITTAFGLGVAIPAVVAYNYFSQRVNDLSLLIETHTLDLAARLPDLPVLGEDTLPAESGRVQ